MSFTSFEKGSGCCTDLEGSAFELWLRIVSYMMKYKVILLPEPIIFFESKFSQANWVL